MDEQSHPSSRPRFSLRLLLLVTTLVVVCVATYAFWIKPRQFRESWARQVDIVNTRQLIDEILADDPNEDVSQHRDFLRRLEAEEWGE